MTYSIFLRAFGNYDPKLVSDETSLECLDKSLAVQSERDDCDINTIVRRFGISGSLPQGVRAPMYGDFTGIFDYQTALNSIRAADESFMAMPADVRSRFVNDPQKFVEFCSDPSNLSEAIKLGLAFPPASPVSEPALPAVASVAQP